MDAIPVLRLLKEEQVLLGYTILEANFDKLLNRELSHIDERHIVLSRNNEERELLLIELWMRFYADLINVLEFIFDVTHWFPIIQEQECIFIQ